MGEEKNVQKFNYRAKNNWGAKLRITISSFCGLFLDTKKNGVHVGLILLFEILLTYGQYSSATVRPSEISSRRRRHHHHFYYYYY